MDPPRGLRFFPYSGVQSDGRHAFAMQTGKFEVIGVWQQVAPAPHWCMFGAQPKGLMQTPSPDESRSLSQELPSDCTPE